MLVRYFKDLVHLVFPLACPGCGSILVEGEDEICIACLNDIEETAFHKIPSENELYFRFAGKVPLSGAAAMYYFDKAGKMQQIIQALKYKHSPKIGRRLGRLYGESLLEGDFLKPYIAIAPVPLHRKREAERGYNQAEEFCKGISEATKLPIIRDALERVKATRSQTRKGREARYENMKEVFKAKTPIKGGILLADDVVTTGATLEACIRALMDQPEPPADIGIVAIAIARGHK